MYSVLLMVVIMAGGAANTLRGRAILPRWAFYLVMGLLAFAVSGKWWYGALWAIGSIIWLSRGWGEGFSAITGRMSTNLGSNPVIEKVCFKLVPDPYATPDAAKKWGFYFMLQRGLYFLYPIFIALAYFTGMWSFLVLGLFGGLQGVCYRMFGCVPEGQYSVACAEVLMGGVLALLMITGTLTFNGFNPY